MAVCLYPEQLVNIFIHWPVIFGLFVFILTSSLPKVAQIHI